ncbi:hypothetical protein Unana1_00284 [Umbelopsis nana]
MTSINPFHQLRTHLAKGTGNLLQEDKHFYVFLQEEKNGLELFKQLAQQRRHSAHAMVTYGRPLGDDLTDATEKVGQLMNYWSDVLNEFTSSFEQYRNTLKTIVEREKVLIADREKKRSLEDRIHTTQRNQPEAVHKVNEYKAQLAELEQKMLPGETEIGNYKRMATKEAFYLLFNGMHELAGKTDIIATTAKYCADKVDVHPIQPGEQRTPYRDTKRALDTWTPDQNKVRRTLTSAHRGRNPLVGRRRPSDVDADVVDKDLPEVPPPEPAGLAPPNPVSSLSTPTSHRDRAQYRRTSIGNTENQNYHDRQSHRLSAPSTGVHGSPYKPDEYRPPSPWDYQSPSPPPNIPSPSYPPGSYYLTPPDYQQYYQFYEQYTPPQPWEEAAPQLIRSPAVFHPSAHQTETRRDAGGFVLPGSIPTEYEHEIRSPTPTSNPQAPESTPRHQPQQEQQPEKPKDKQKPAVQHMPGDFPDDATAENKAEKPNAAKPAAQFKPEQNKGTAANTTNSGGAKVSALLAKFQNLSNNK